MGARSRVGALVAIAVATLAAASSRVGVASSFVQNENHPIVVDGQLFGGTRNTRWLARAGFPKTKKGKPVSPHPGEPVLVESPLLQGTETFRLYGAEGFVGYGQANKLRYTVDQLGNERYEVAVKPKDKHAGPWRVAINGDWNGQPRPFKEVKAQKLFVVDIDGDGKEERVRVQKKAQAHDRGRAASKPSSGATGNDTDVLTFEMNGKSLPLTSIEIDAELTTSWQLMAFDFDGDGKLELLLTTSGKDPVVELYEIKGSKPVMVLATPPDP